MVAVMPLLTPALEVHIFRKKRGRTRQGSPQTKPNKEVYWMSCQGNIRQRGQN
jgi:hypothetical protein